MVNISTRSATAEDLDRITEIYRPAVVSGTASFELDPPNEAEMRRRYDAIMSAGFPYLVAVKDNTVAGYAYANAYRPRPAYRFTVEDSIYVDPAFHGLGIGHKLLDQLILLTTDMGFRQMIAVIGDSAQQPSIRLHRNAGFQFAGTLHAIGYKHDRWLDGVLMQRALGPGDTAPPSHT